MRNFGLETWREEVTWETNDLLSPKEFFLSCRFSVLDIHVSVHHYIIYENDQQDATV